MVTKETIGSNNNANNLVLDEPVISLLQEFLERIEKEAEENDFKTLNFEFLVRLHLLCVLNLL